MSSAATHTLPSTHTHVATWHRPRAIARGTVLLQPAQAAAWPGNAAAGTQSPSRRRPQRPPLLPPGGSPRDAATIPHTHSARTAASRDQPTLAQPLPTRATLRPDSATTTSGGGSSHPRGPTGAHTSTSSTALEQETLTTTHAPTFPQSASRTPPRTTALTIPPQPAGAQRPVLSGQQAQQAQQAEAPPPQPDTVRLKTVPVRHQAATVCFQTVTVRH